MKNLGILKIRKTVTDQIHKSATSGFPKRKTVKREKGREHGNNRVHENSRTYGKAYKRIALIAFLVATLLFSFGSRYLSFVPTWNEIYKIFGIAPNSYDTLDFEPMPLTLTALDVGQGECVFIYDEKGVAILYDTGEAGNEDNIVNYLKNFGVDTIDYLILSHPHSDHIGSAEGILSSGEISIDNVIVAKSNSKNSNEDYYGTLLKKMKAAGAGVVEAEAGYEVSAGDTVITVLAPTCIRENLNNMSLVVRIAYGETVFLLMGDAESEEEYDLLRTQTPARLLADVLVVGHHGSETSSTYDFISSVTPKYAVISCGADNKYGHPHAVTLNTLDAVKSKVYRTDLMGNVVIGSDGKKTIALR